MPKKQKKITFKKIINVYHSIRLFYISGRATKHKFRFKHAGYIWNIIRLIHS